MQTRILFLALFAALSANAFGQKDGVPDRKFSVGVPYLIFLNSVGGEEINTRHYEFHFKYDLTPKDKIGVKFATWSLFRPMGMLYWEDGVMDIKNKSEHYPGRLEERGIGVSYQRMLWKGLFAAVEVLPQYKRYLDENKNEIGDGFKLYTSFHIGYHISLFNKSKNNFLRNRFFIEPQVHGQWWFIDTNTPQEFRAKDDKWHNFFLPELNLYLGFKF